MKKLVLASAALALVLTTGFTCSKNAPTEATAPAAPAEQAPMAAPASGDATAPAAPAPAPAPTN
ncbi:MAG: hypothetical protein K0R29_279 [Pseudobdellovibrio sp.]|nr:hypothetical protein [Pseudobdellovibrio sp.]